MCYQCSDYEYEPCPDNYPDCQGSCYGFDCAACGVNTLHINEFYMIHDEIWNEAWPDERAMLCIGCVEVQIGRALTANDFTDAPVNHGFVIQSERLASRLSSE